MGKPFSNIDLLACWLSTDDKMMQHREKLKILLDM
jgi:hypothetical protein